MANQKAVVRIWCNDCNKYWDVTISIRRKSDGSVDYQYICVILEQRGTKCLKCGSYSYKVDEKKGVHFPH
ncbi:hypothetical protein ACFL29_01360 [Patescibacteria group bacterium]